MLKTLNRKILVILIVLLSMVAGTAVDVIGLRAEGSFGEPGLSFRYVWTMGVTGEPYISDTIHLNRPKGLFFDENDNIYVTEESGNRLLKYDHSGVNLLSIGVAGVSSTDLYNFNGIKDTAVDSSLNIWVADWHRILQYDQNGEFLQELPANDSWQSGNTNERFDDVGGIAIDTDKLFVSDSNNHRIQIFDISGEYPVYSATIGVTGEMSNDVGKFNSPSRIALDANGNLYVVDTGNNRIQICKENGDWNCSIFEDNLNNPLGIAVHGDDVYIADTYNWRILKCSGGICHHFNSEGDEFHDVAIDLKGDIYASSAYRSTVFKFDNAGEAEIFLGEAFVPYLTDEHHFNSPRVVIDHSDNIVVIEEGGQRLLKYNPQGDFLWSVGTPGVTGHTNHQFNFPHAVAVDQANNIFVADGWRIQKFNPSGIYLGTLLDEGGLPFDWITGVAVDLEGNILLSMRPSTL